MAEGEFHPKISQKCRDARSGEGGRTDGLPGRGIVSIHARGRARASDAPLNRPVAVGEGGIGMRTTLALARAPN